MSINKTSECDDTQIDSIFNRYLNLLDSNCKDFKELKTKYTVLYHEIKEIFKYASQLNESYENMYTAEILFFFNRGVGDNWCHFTNPHKSFTDTEFDVCFEEFREYDEYKTAYSSIQQSVALMPEKAKAIYYDMLEYFAFLDVYLPKIAHYNGFMSANSILKNKSREYKEDEAFNAAYTEWIEKYLDIKIR